MNPTDPTVITFGIYLLAMLGIGWAGYRATTNLSDYILGGRAWAASSRRCPPAHRT